MVPLLLVPFVVGLGIALAAGWMLIPLLRRLKAKQVISTDAPKRHLAKGGTPTMGGIIILTGAVVAALAYSHPAVFGTTLAVVLCTLACGLVGFVDDLLIIVRGKNLGLRAREKLAGQFLVAILFAGWFYSVDPSVSAPGGHLFSPVRLLLAGYHVLLIVGLSNAVNLTDGLDGLAAGVSLPVWICLALLGAWVVQSPPNSLLGRLFPVTGDWGIVGFCAAFAGATLGYLWYNAHPAQIFMGDTGSLAIGGGMAAAAIVMHAEWVVLLIALVHLAEAASVTAQVISFKTTGKRIFKMSPLHHHFELCDWPETRIVARFSICSAVCGALALVILFWS